MRRTWSVQLLLLVISEIPQTAVHSYRVEFVRTIPMMSHSKEMFISDRKVLNTMCTSSLQGLVQCELFSRFIYLVNHGACLVFVNISIMVSKGEEQTSINGKMLNSHSSSGWQVLNFLEEVETSWTFFDKKQNKWLTRFISHSLFLVIRPFKVAQNGFDVFNHHLFMDLSFGSLLFSEIGIRKCKTAI